MSMIGALSAELPGISPDVYGEADFRAIAGLVHREAGIVLPPGKAMLVYSRVSPLVRQSGCATFAAYVERLASDPAERDRTVSALTTNHTFFYREEHHFHHFAQTVRPRLVTTLEEGGPVRIWSAGCSSGEETWSLAMTLLGEDRAAGIRLAERDLRILASDIAPHALSKAVAAVYEPNDLKSVPPGLRKAWVRSGASQAEMAPEMQAVVRFRPLNLLGQWPIKRPFDVIFCRNVMIYFDQPTKERLVERFARQLVPGGFLYIGHSERATGPAASLLEAVGPTIYRRIAA